MDEAGEVEDAVVVARGEAPNRFAATISSFDPVAMPGHESDDPALTNR